MPRNENAAKDAALFTAVAALSFLLLAAQPGALSQNAQVHAALARLYAAGNFSLSGLGVLSHGEFASGFVDQHLLFHAALAPLTRILPGYLALNVLAALGLGTLALALSRLLPARFFGLPAALLFCGLPVLDRLYWQRPAPWVLAVLFFALAEGLRERPRAAPSFLLGLLGFALSLETLLALPLLLLASLLGPKRGSRTLALRAWAAGTALSLPLHAHPLARLRLLGATAWSHFLRAPVPEWRASEGSLLALGAVVAALVVVAASDPRPRSAPLRWRQAPPAVWAAFAVLAALALRADRFGPGALLLGAVLLAWMLDGPVARLPRPAVIALASLLIAFAGTGAWRLERELYGSDGHTAGDPRAAFSFLRDRGWESSPVLLQNWSDWSALFELDSHTRAEPGFSLGLYEEGGFRRAYTRWAARPTPARWLALAPRFGASPPRFVLSRRAFAARFFANPDLYVPAYLDEKYALFELAPAWSAPGPRLPAAPAAAQVSAAWRLFLGEKTGWPWTAEIVCVEGLGPGSPGRACWRNFKGAARLTEDRRSGARPRAIRLHLLRALSGDSSAAAALRPGARGARALVFPGGALFLGDDLLFRYPGALAAVALRWEAARALADDAYYSPGPGDAHPYALGTLPAEPLGRRELGEAGRLAASFLLDQLGPDGALLYQRSLADPGADRRGGRTAAVRLNHAAYVLCETALSKVPALAPRRRALADGCAKAAAHLRDTAPAPASQNLGELATLGLALQSESRVTGRSREPELAAIETEIRSRYRGDRFAVSHPGDEVFHPGEAALFLSLRPGGENRALLASLIPYYRNLFRSSPRARFLVRWFGEAMSRYHGWSADPAAASFLDELLSYAVNSLAPVGSPPWMEGCPSDPRDFPAGAAPYPHHLAGLWLEGLAVPSHRGPAFAARQRMLAAGLSRCLARQQLRDWNLDTVPRQEGSVGTWRYGLGAPGSRIDVHAHAQLGVLRAAELLPGK